MIGQTDWAGVAAVIAAVFAGIASLIGAWNARTVTKVKAQVDTNGDPRTIGQIASDVAQQVGAHPTGTPPAP
jgi:hypothetical protein